MPYLEISDGKEFSVIDYKCIGVMNLISIDKEDPTTGRLQIYDKRFNNYHYFDGKLSVLSEYIVDWKEWIDRMDERTDNG